MKLLAAFLFTGVLIQTEALNCWVCENAKSNEECRKQGDLKMCNWNEGACQNEVRRGSDGLRVSKRCKETHACDNNFIQNPKSAWEPSQCNSKTPSSVCRCCCNFDRCNAPSLGCQSSIDASILLDSKFGMLDEQTYCEPIGKPRNGRKTCEPNQQLHELGTVCKFSCFNGFRLIGFHRSVCRKDPLSTGFRFTKPAPKCRPQSCKPAQVAPENGNMYCTNSNKVRSICKFSCQQGYVMLGSSSTRCGGNRRWNNVAPSCIKVICLPPHSNLVNGEVACSDENDLGSQCDFTCDAGYALSGPPASTCVRNSNFPGVGLWDKLAPSCDLITCTPQNNPANGNVDCTKGENIGSVCVFTCNSGYALDGNSETTCIAGITQGNWNNPVPTCNPIKCTPRIAELPNGIVTCDDDNVLGSTCTFVCVGMFDLIGEPELICQMNKEAGNRAEWSELPPTCQERAPQMCAPLLVAPVNGIMVCDNDNLAGSNCAFTCDDTFELVGNFSSVCTLQPTGDVEWSNPEPTCQPLRCDVLEPPQNGTLLCSNSNFVNSVCDVMCNKGHRREGAAATECRVVNGRGVWGAPTAACRPIFCIPQTPAQNGRIDCTDKNAFNSVCDHICDEAFYLDGEIQSTCIDAGGETGTWNNPTPSCNPIICQEVIPVENGEVSCSNANQYNSVCEFQCDEEAGYQLYPPNLKQTVCVNDSAWDLPQPCCARQCPPYALMDLVILLDSSSSIQQSNWDLLKAFVRRIIDSFVISASASRISVFRFNQYVDRRSQILLRDHPDNKTSLLAAYDKIPYNGRGTKTGQAIAHVTEEILTIENGDRPDVRDIVLVITDGRSQDDVATESDDLRAHGALTYAVGIEPGHGRGLNRTQLLQIAGYKGHLLIAEDGFSGLDDTLSSKITEQICGNRCVEDFDHDNHRILEEVFQSKPRNIF